MCLLSLYIESGAEIVAVNVEHGIRGEESVADSRFVSDFCHKAGVNLLRFNVDAPARAKKEGISLELAARDLRYEIFDGLLADGTADRIALAHHLDDQTETILMRLFRGTGIRGLRGITDRKGYIHPLISYKKSEILEYCRENQIPFVEDGTNRDLSYTRNYIRKEIAPAISARYPGFEYAIERLALSAAEIEEFLLSQITPARLAGGVAYLPVEALSRKAAIAKKSVIETLRLIGIEKDIESAHLELIISLRNADNNAKINLPFGVDAVKEYGEIAFLLRRGRESFKEFFDPNKTYYFGGFGYSFEPCEGIINGISFDIDAIPEGAVIRSRETGDVFKRYGGGTKSLSDYLTDKRLPARIRDKLLVIASGKNVLAVLGVEVGEAVKITEKTKKIYKTVIRQEEI